MKKIKTFVYLALCGFFIYEIGYGIGKAIAHLTN